MVYLISSAAEYGLPKRLGSSAHRNPKCTDSDRMAQKRTRILAACEAVRGKCSLTLQCRGRQSLSQSVSLHVSQEVCTSLLPVLQQL